jgi:hypothetical protein
MASPEAIFPHHIQRRLYVLFVGQLADPVFQTKRTDGSYFSALVWGGVCVYALRIVYGLIETGDCLDGSAVFEAGLRNGELYLAASAPGGLLFLGSHRYALGAGH